MFQLIAAVIAIFLLGLMVLAALYYGGDAHSDAKIRADYSGNMNTGAQIEGALRLYFNEEGTYPPSNLADTALLQHLVDKGYLKDTPAGNWTVNPQELHRPIKNQTVDECVAMNRVAGVNMSSASDIAGAPYNGCPPCKGAEGSAEEALANKYKSWPVCQLVD